MTTTLTPTATTRTPRDWTRKHAFAGGALYLITFAASIPALLLLRESILDNPDYILGSGSESQVLWACLLDVVNALAAVGTAVAVYPVVKRHGHSLALGFVTSRLVEAAVILTGVVSLLAVVTLRQDFAGATGDDASVLVITGQALEAVRDWTFLLGPGLMASFNALLFGTLLYRSGLVPRIIPTIGLIGAPLLLTATIATFFGHNEQTSAITMLATLPIAAWELSVGFWMLTRGFRPTAATMAPPSAVPAAPMQ